MYGKMSTEEMVNYSLDWPWLKTYRFTHPDYPTLHFQRATRKREKPLNIVIVLQESLGATFVESLRGEPVTPQLEQLKMQGMWFQNLYASGHSHLCVASKRSLQDFHPPQHKAW